MKGIKLKELCGSGAGRDGSEDERCRRLGEIGLQLGLVLFSSSEVVHSQSPTQDLAIESQVASCSIPGFPTEASLPALSDFLESWVATVDFCRYIKSSPYIQEQHLDSAPGTSIPRLSATYDRKHRAHPY